MSHYDDEFDFDFIFSDTCSICLERFNNDDVFLECMHRFHDQCIRESMRHSKYCPNCRQPAKLFS